MTVQKDTYNFIESGIIFGTKTVQDLEKHDFSPDDLVLHRDAYDFMFDYFDTYEKFPNEAILQTKFEDLDSSAREIELDYALAGFRKHSLTRKAIEAIKLKQRDILINPEEAVSSLIGELSALDVGRASEIVWYDDGQQDRLLAYKNRVAERGRKVGIVGIPTPLKTLNVSGIGMLPGDLYSVFARPEVGKTWYLIKTAAIAMSQGYKVLFITPEMPEDQISLRLDVVVGRMQKLNFSLTNLIAGNPINEKEYEGFLKNNSERNILICDHMENGNINFPGIASLARRHQPDLLIIDGMELINVGRNEKYGAQWEKLGILYGQVKSLCTSMKIAGLVAHQANRAAADVFRPPQAGEVSGGDALIRFSDAALSMSLLEDEEHKRVVSFQKFRGKPYPATESVIINFDGDKGIFTETDGFKDR